VTTRYKSRGQTRRQRLERTADLYLRGCYEKQTAARASEFATQIGLTREHLTRIVAEIFGMSVREFLRVRQLEHARDLLTTTSVSMVQVALSSGFGTHPAFYRAFKAAFGMTPGRYRNITK
jgi:AraC-like DNA-binding protein